MSAKRTVDQTLAALADPYRRRAVELLGQRPRRAGELAEALGLPAPAMSRHLRAPGGVLQTRVGTGSKRANDQPKHYHQREDQPEQRAARRYRSILMLESKKGDSGNDQAVYEKRDGFPAN